MLLRNGDIVRDQGLARVLDFIRLQNPLPDFDRLERLRVALVDQHCLVLLLAQDAIVFD